ncbi:transposase [Tissierella carlieri]
MTKPFGFILSSIILSEIGDIELFSTPAKLLAFAEMKPSTY